MNVKKTIPRDDIAVWENEGGAPDIAGRIHQYGRRIEGDGSWTIYHVFTGVPADGDGRPMAGLNEMDATRTMLALNRRGGRMRKPGFPQAFAKPF